MTKRKKENLANFDPLQKDKISKKLDLKKRHVDLFKFLTFGNLCTVQNNVKQYFFAIPMAVLLCFLTYIYIYIYIYIIKYI